MLDLPWDILLSTIEENEPMDTGPAVLHSGVARDADIRQIIDRVSSSQRPVIVIGSEAMRSDTRDAVERLAKATNVPVFAEFEGLGLLRNLPAPLFGGLVQSLYGLGAQAPDLVLMAGMRFGLYTAHGTGTLIPHAAHVIQIDPDAREIGRLQPVQFGVAADVGLTLEALATVAETVASPDRASWQAIVRGQVKKRYTAISGHVKERPGMLHPLRASDIVAEHVTKDITVVADGALTYLWLSEVIAEPRPAALMFHSHLSSMGCGFGIAIGAQAAWTQASASSS